MYAAVSDKEPKKIFHLQWSVFSVTYFGPKKKNFIDVF